MRQIRSRLRAAVALSLAFVAHADATATYDYRERDPSATIGQYGEAEKSEDESDEPAALYHVWFDAEGECELLPNDKSRVLNTQPVKQQETKE